MYSATFIGYGGMSVQYETRVYNYRGFEIRVPRCPSEWTNDEISNEYNCIGARSVKLGKATVDEMIDERSHHDYH